MGCGSSSSSGTEQSNKVKNQQVVSKQEVGVNYNPTAAVIKSSNGQLSSVKTTNNDQSLSQDRTTTTDNVQSLSQDQTTCTNNDQYLSEDRTTTTNNDQSLSEGRTRSTIDDQSLSLSRTTSTNNDQSLSQDRTTSINNDQSLSQGQTITSSKVKSRDLKLNYDDFKDIDEHARQASTSVEESIETLAKYLAKPAKNDIEVVRALYVWICENIRYDTNAYFGGNLSSLDTSGKGVLTSKSSVCAGYANLFESLCQALGITCKKISGYAKGYGHNLGDTITFSQKTNHAWNAVRLEGVWRFIETTWGAGYVDKNQEFIKKFNNFYFLTSPENFIYDHFPYFNSNIEESKQWQLLEKPISIEEYAKKIKPSKEARQYGVKFSHPYVIIDNSPCTVIVESSAHPFQNCWFDFYNDKGSKCTDAAIMLCADNKECKTTVRPQFGGKYTLCLHAKIKGENTTLAEYIINCGTAESNWKPYPNYGGFYGPKLSFTERGFESFCINPSYTCKDGKFHLSLKTSSTPEVLVQLHDAENIDHKENLMVQQNDTSINIRSRLLNKGYYKLELFSKVDEKYTLASTVLILNTGESDWKPFPKNTGHYGPKPDFTDRGFENSCIKPFYECKDGNFRLFLKTTSTPEILVQLHDAENVDHEENLMVEQNDNSVRISSRLFNKGYYKLGLFSKGNEKYTLAYTVLILNTGESNWKPFPKNTGHYGPKQNFTDRGFERSGINPFYECKDGNFQLRLKTTSTPEVLVQLHDAENVDHKENLMVEQNDTSINIRSRLLNKGYYKLALFSKVDEKYTLAYTVLILNTGESDWTPFPKNTGHYGPTPDFTERGFEKSGINPFYECKDGNFQLLLKTTSTPEVLVQLHDAENIDHKDYLMVEQSNSSLNIRSRLLNKGFYKLDLFSKVDQKYTLAYTILIQTTVESDVISMFPITHTTTTKYKCQLFQPLVRELPPNSDICFEFDSPAFEGILANTKSFSEKSGEKWKVTVTTGESGELSLSGKPTGESSYWPVYTFVINS